MSLVTMIVFCVQRRKEEKKTTNHQKRKKKKKWDDCNANNKPLDVNSLKRPNEIRESSLFFFKRFQFFHDKCKCILGSLTLVQMRALSLGLIEPIWIEICSHKLGFQYAHRPTTMTQRWWMETKPKRQEKDINEIELGWMWTLAREHTML